MVFASRAGGRRGDLRKLARWARVVLAHTDAARCDLSLVLGDDAFLSGLNHQYRQLANATDVLSFPQDGAEGPLLGDVVISVQTAAAQAREQQHSLDDELQVLLVHGICHLLGHDHHEPGETEAMRREERRLLSALHNEVAGLVQRAAPR